MNRRIRRASARGEWSRAWWMQRDHSDRTVRRARRVIAAELAPALASLADDLAAALEAAP